MEAEDEEEVWLFWKDNCKEIRSKSIRELALDAKEGQKEDEEVVSYYRCSEFDCSHISMCSKVYLLLISSSSIIYKFDRFYYQTISFLPTLKKQ